MLFCHSFCLAHLFLTNPWDNTRLPHSLPFKEPVIEEPQILANTNQLTPGSYDISLKYITGRVISARDFASRTLGKSSARKMVDEKCQERNWVSILRIVKPLHFNAFKFGLIHSQ